MIRTTGKVVAVQAARATPYETLCLEQPMANDARQNPANKWGRYSGAGAAGISEVVPSEAEARRGLEPFSIGGNAASARALALGGAAMLGAAIAAFAVWQARRPRDLPTRVLRKVRRR